MILSKPLYLTFVPALFVLAVIAVVSVRFEIPMPVITRDATSLADVHPLTGFLSSLGILLWCATAAICLFCAGLIRETRGRGDYRFFLLSGFLSMYLLFDDLFLIHEALVPEYLGVGQRYVILFLGIGVLGYLVAFRQVILGTNYSLLISALGFLGASVALDQFFERWMWGLGHWVYFIEDGAKWLGIVSWCGYYTQAARRVVAGGGNA